MCMVLYVYCFIGRSCDKGVVLYVYWFMDVLVGMCSVLYVIVLYVYCFVCVLC